METEKAELKRISCDREIYAAVIIHVIFQLL